MASGLNDKDAEIIPEKATHEEFATREEAMHFGALTEEELAIEAKLRRKIDIRIMPVVISVYLMNYIDR